jgi:peptide/nickel transport system permease protein
MKHWPLSLTFGAGLITLLAIGAFFGAMIGMDGGRGDLAMRLRAPFDGVGPLGSDALGRDLLARTLAGFSWSLSIAVASTMIAAMIGVILGMIGAARAGFVRAFVSWAANTITTLPGLVLAIVIVAIIGQGWGTIVATLGLLTWPVFARVTLAEAGSILARDYVVAARVAGTGGARILATHVAPNMRAALVVMGAFHFADMIIAESALSFLGLGAPLGQATWGNMLAESRAYVFSAPWMVLAPAGAIVVSVIAVNLIGVGLTRLWRRGAS